MHSAVQTADVTIISYKLLSVPNPNSQKSTTTWAVKAWRDWSAGEFHRTLCRNEKATPTWIGDDCETS